MLNIEKFHNIYKCHNKHYEIRECYSKCPIYMITITSRKKHTDYEKFCYEFDKFLDAMNVGGFYTLVPEYHTQPGKKDQLHLHGIFTGNISKLGNLKRQAKNKFQVHYIEAKDQLAIDKWYSYIKKSLEYTLSELGYPLVNYFDCSKITPPSDTPSIEYISSSESE